MQHDVKLIPDAKVFTQVLKITLADVLAKVEAEYEGTALRDTRSAFQFLTDRAELDLAAKIATPAELRAIFENLVPQRLGVSQKRLANIRSCLTRAVERFGQRRTHVTRDVPLSPDWRDLLATIPQREHGWTLSRLAAYCSAKGVAPNKVEVRTLAGLFAALEAEAVSKNPRNLLKQTVAVWNMCRKRVDGWPDTRLSSPFKTDPYMMPLEDFPESFQQEVAAWEVRMSTPDPLDPTAPVRAYRPETLKGYRFTFRRLATALVRSSQASIEEITGFEVFFDENHFKEALRPFLQGARIKTEQYVYKMATQLIAVGRHHLGYDEDRLQPFVAIARRLKPKGGASMGDRNRERLQQFDNETVVARLLSFPEEELARALKITNPSRKAKGVERALAISLAVFTGLRVKNLRLLDLEANIRRSGDRVFVRISEDETKTHAPLELELPPETIALLTLFVDEHRQYLPGSESSYLFTGAFGGARSYSAMRDALGKPLLKHAGIRLSPHLFRHIVAKIVVERCPELAMDVSRRLGHKSINTLYGSYLGTEGPAASRRISALLSDIRDDSTGAGP